MTSTIRTITEPAGQAGQLRQTEGKETREESKLRKAAEDFEGLLLGQMLQSIRESALGGWQENHDQAGAVALEMAESQLAQVMASQGGLGIARTLQASMKSRKKEESSEPEKPSLGEAAKPSASGPRGSGG